MRCLYCDQDIKKISLYSFVFKEDRLCINCRNKMTKNHKRIKIDELEIESFYDYNSLFKSLIIQYKECYDELLSEVFLYGIKEYINIKYRDYKIIYMPSSKEKLNKRGFNHLQLVFEELDLEVIGGLRYKEEFIQQGKNINERAKMKDNFIYEGDRLDKVLIVDDVLTTGSSVVGAYRALKPYCKVIKALVLASV